MESHTVLPWKTTLPWKVNLKLKIILLWEIQLPQHPFTGKEYFLKIRSFATKGHHERSSYLERCRCCGSFWLSWGRVEGARWGHWNYAGVMRYKFVCRLHRMLPQNWFLEDVVSARDMKVIVPLNMSYNEAKSMKTECFLSFKSSNILWFTGNQV